jgi:hypothetical protein
MEKKRNSCVLLLKNKAEYDVFFKLNHNKADNTQYKIPLSTILKEIRKVFRTNLIYKNYGNFDNYVKCICSDADKPNNNLILFESKNNFNALYVINQIQKSLNHHNYLTDEKKNI